MMKCKWIKINIFIPHSSPRRTAQCSPQKHTHTHTQGWLHGWATWASSQGLAWKDPTLSFMLCCSYLEILSNFQTRNPAFSFCTRSCKLCSQSYTYARTHTDTHTLSIYVCVRTRRGPYPIHDLRAKLCLCTGVSQVIHQIIQWVVASEQPALHWGKSVHFTPRTASAAYLAKYSSWDRLTAKICCGEVREFSSHQHWG